MSKLFAVSGTKGSGKDTVTSMLQYLLSVPKMLQNYTCYELFHKFIKPKYKRLAFADPLKEMLAILLNVPVQKFNNRQFKEDCVINIPTLEYSLCAYNEKSDTLSDSKFNKLVKNLDPTLVESNLTIRQLMQYFGTEICQRFFGRRIGINSTLKHCIGPTIISDLRFKEEYCAIKERNGITIFVNRPSCEFGQHASEKEMEELLNNSKYDFIILNNSSLKNLFNAVKECIAKI